MAETCSKAIELDNLDEEMHYLFIKALIGQNKTTLALDHYSKATSLLYENLGVRPSKKLQTVYRQLMEAKHCLLYTSRCV